jgi:hypothetical protein
LNNEDWIQVGESISDLMADWIQVGESTNDLMASPNRFCLKKALPSALIFSATSVFWTSLSAA